MENARLVFQTMALLALLRVSCAAQEGPPQGTAQYRIDWNGGLLVVSAEGASDPDKALNQGDAKVQAGAVANYLADEKLAEVILGVSITGKATLRNVFKKDTEQQTRIAHGLIQNGVQTVKQTYEAMPDGSVLATWVKAVKLLGSNSIASRAFSIAPVRQEVIAESAGSESAAMPAVEQKHTGVIVDVRGLLAFQKTLAIKIVSDDGKTLYGPGTVDQRRLEAGDMVKYCLSEEDARLSIDRVGKAPLYLKAASISEQAFDTVIVSGVDAQKLQSAAAALRAGKLIVVF